MLWKERAVIHLLAGLIVFLILITPVTLRLDLRWIHTADLLIAPRFWGLGPTLRLRVEKTQHGHQVFRIDKHGNAKPLKLPSSPSAAPSLHMLRSALQGGPLRWFIRGLSLMQFDVALNVSLDNAARTALTAGAAQSLWRALPCAWRKKARLQVRPDFLSGQGGAQARWIVFFHLGTLLITAAMLMIRFGLERIEHPAHSVKEA